MKKYIFLILLINLNLHAVQRRHLYQNKSEEEKLYVKAKDAYDYGRTEKSKKLLDKAMDKGLKSNEALVLNEKIKKDLSKKDTVVQQKMHNKLLEEVKESWNIENIAQKRDNSNKDKELTANKQLLEDLSSLMVDSISFNDLLLSQALDLLSEEAASSHKKQFNFLLLDPKNRNPKIKLHFKCLSFYDILKYMAQAADCRLTFERNAVVLRYEQDMQNVLSTKFFPITRGTVVQIVENSTSIKNPSKDKKVVLKEEKIIKNFFSKSGINFNIEGSDLAFDGSNIIVTHTPFYLQKVANILRRYREVKQVAIEAKFIEVQQGALEEIGMNFRAGGLNNRSKFQLGQNLRGVKDINAPSIASETVIHVDNNNPVTIPNAPPNIPNNLNVGMGALPVANVIGVLSGTELGFLMRALEQNADTDLMSAPKLTVLSGKKAEIIVAQEMRYPEKYTDTRSDVGSGYTGIIPGTQANVGAAGVTITAGTPMNFVTRNVGVEMSVTPTVEKENRISLKLEPCVTEFEGFVEYGGNHLAIACNRTVRIPSGFFQPIFSTRQIKTEVTVFDGATVVMGGLTREEVKSTSDRVPVFGSIPIIGKLFSSKGYASQKRNLLICVTANLLTPSGTLLRDSRENICEENIWN